MTKTVFCLQPKLNQYDYSNAEKFSYSLESLLRRTITSAELTSEDKNQFLFIFPEFIGTWLVFANESSILFHNIFTYLTHTVAMLFLILFHFPSFSFIFFIQFFSPVFQFFQKNSLSPMFLFKQFCYCKWLPHIIHTITKSIFLLKCKVMLCIYLKTMHYLSNTFGCYIIGGSLFLPEFLFQHVVTNHKSMKMQELIYSIQSFSLFYIATHGQLVNVGFSFDPNGHIIHCYKKDYITEAEVPLLLHKNTSFVNSSAEYGPFGKIGVLICADTWYPKPIQKYLEQEQVNLLVGVACNIPRQAWFEPWQGYSNAKGNRCPNDVDPHDIRSQTLGAMWSKYSLQGRIQQSMKHYKANHFQGALLSHFVFDIHDLQAGGISYITSSSGEIVKQASSIDQETVLSLPLL